MQTDVLSVWGVLFSHFRQIRKQNLKSYHNSFHIIVINFYVTILLYAILHNSGFEIMNRYRLELNKTEGFLCSVGWNTMNVGPCHHGMARPQVADGGTASSMEGSCELIE
jgi:hypothetical protein